MLPVENSCEGDAVNCLTLVRHQALLKRLNKFRIIHSPVAGGCRRSELWRVRRSKQRSTTKAGPPSGLPTQCEGGGSNFI